MSSKNGESQVYKANISKPFGSGISVGSEVEIGKFRTVAAQTTNMPRADSLDES